MGFLPLIRMVKILKGHGTNLDSNKLITNTFFLLIIFTKILCGGPFQIILG